MVDPLSSGKEHIQHTKSTDKTDGGSVLKPDSTQPKVKTGLLANGQETNFSISATMNKNSVLVKNTDESMRSDDVSAKAHTKGAAESDVSNDHPPTMHLKLHTFLIIRVDSIMYNFLDISCI